jgi:hypothetical protein
MLPEPERRLHRTLIDAVVRTGTVPPDDVMVAVLTIDRDELDRRLQTLRRADYLAFDGAGRLTCLYPFSTLPTPHVVSIDGARRFAMCSLDALGVAAMLGQPVAIESACAACGSPVRIAVRPGAIVRVDPSETMVVATHASDAPAVEACCAFTMFACGPAHADDVLARMSNASALDLDAALAAGESLFGGLLDETLPAKRRRSRSGAPIGPDDHSSSPPSTSAIASSAVQSVSINACKPCA